MADDFPSVSIVTPTFPGRSKVLERALDSIIRQDYPGHIQVVVASDRNAITRNASIRIDARRRIDIVEINEAWRNGLLDQDNGCFPWMIGSFLALGDFIGFLGDDDELLPHHVRTHVDAMREAEALWSLSKVDFRANGSTWNIIGDDTYALGHLDADGIMCYKDTLKYGNWNPWQNSGNAPDHALVSSWRHRNLPGIFIDEVTAIHNDGWLVGMTGKPYE